jgi:site-specific recombinase XerD
VDRLLALIVREAKWSNEDRCVYLEGDASRVLEAYLALRQKLLGPGAVPWLFPSFRGSRVVGGISRWGVSEIVARRCREQGIEAKGRILSARILRHSIATHLVAAGVHLREVQEHLRHRSPSSTQVYAHAATGANRALLLERHHPLRGRSRRPEVAAASIEVLRQLHAGLSSLSDE